LQKFLENLEEVGKFLDMHGFPKLNEEDIKHSHRPRTKQGDQRITVKLPTKKISGADRLIAEFYQTFKE
jgi:hypothetical protein